LQAVATIANQIAAGEIEIGIGGGVESMSMYDMMSSVDPEKVADAVFEHPEAQKCLMPMGITSENVAEKYGISRET
jgi:acetyl-CoA acyltransferase 1